jgi:hypothetical protein
VTTVPITNGEYETIAEALTSKAVILGDNAHCTAELAKFSVQHAGNSFKSDQTIGIQAPGSVFPID